MWHSQKREAYLGCANYKAVSNVGDEAIHMHSKVTAKKMRKCVDNQIKTLYIQREREIRNNTHILTKSPSLRV